MRCPGQIEQRSPGRSCEQRVLCSTYKNDTCLPLVVGILFGQPSQGEVEPARECARHVATLSGQLRGRGFITGHDSDGESVATK